MGRPYHLKRVFSLGALFAMVALTSAAQQPDDLQKQVEQLKQQYEQTTREMQQRISALEKQIQDQKASSESAKQGAVSSVELAAEQAAHKAVLGEPDQVGAKFQGQVPPKPTSNLFNEPTNKLGRSQNTLQ